MRDDAILDALASVEDIESAIGLFHYHGTLENFDDEPRGGGFDDIFWCADAPSIAQLYIPASGGEMLLSVPSYAMNDLVRPSLSPSGTPMGLYAAALQFGCPPAFDVRRDRSGNVESWGCREGYPRNRDIVRALVEMGYEWTPGRDFSAWVKMAREGETDVLKPASFTKPGRLFIVDGIRELRMLDLASGREGDLTEPDHLKLDVFRRAETDGYDGVIIPDFLQSDELGNFGHVSWGVFTRSMNRLRYTVIPASRREPLPNSKRFERTTPEFDQVWQMHGRQTATFAP